MQRKEKMIRIRCKDIDPSTRAPAMAGGHSLGIPPENRGVVLSERSGSKDDGSGAPGLPGMLHGYGRLHDQNLGANGFIQRAKGAVVLR